MRNLPNRQKKRKSKQCELLQRSLFWLRADKAKASPNMVLEQRTERNPPLGYDGFARNSDRVSTNIVLSELDKVCFVKNRRIRVVTRELIHS